MLETFMHMDMTTDTHVRNEDKCVHNVSPTCLMKQKLIKKWTRQVACLTCLRRVEHEYFDLVEVSVAHSY